MSLADIDSMSTMTTLRFVGRLSGVIGRAIGRYAFDAGALVVVLHTAYSFSVGHEAQLFVFGPHVVEGAGEEAEHGVYAEVVEHGVGAEVGGADFNGVVAQTAANTKKTGAEQGDGKAADAEQIAPGEGAAVGYGGRGALYLLLNAAAQGVEPVGEDTEDNKIGGYIKIIGGFAKYHAEGGAAVVGPVPDRGVEGFAEVAEIGDISGTGHEHEGIHHAKPPAVGAQQPRAPPA